jgi:hypothetical protein
VVGIDLPALLVQVEDDQHRDNYFFLAFDLVRQGPHTSSRRSYGIM